MRIFKIRLFNELFLHLFIKYKLNFDFRSPFLSLLTWDYPNTFFFGNFQTDEYLWKINVYSGIDCFIVTANFSEIKSYVKVRNWDQNKIWLKAVLFYLFIFKIHNYLAILKLYFLFSLKIFKTIQWMFNFWRKNILFLT